MKCFLLPWVRETQKLSWQRGLYEKAGEEHEADRTNTVEVAVNTRLLSSSSLSVPPHRHPSNSTDLKAFGFSAAAAALSIKLKFIVDLKWNKYLYSLTGTHTLVHMRCNKDVETQTPLLRSLGIKSLDSLNNPPLLFPSIGTLFICILSFTPAVFPSAPPSLRFLQ